VIRLAFFSLPRCLGGGALCKLALAGPLLALCVGDVRADFTLCNNTSGKVGISLGYKDNEGWVTEGWWNLGPRSCEKLLRGTLVARYYYVYAIDYDRGGEWSGKAFMCSREKEFTIRGTEDCLARGFDRTGFFEVDTGEQRAWTVQLTETSDQSPITPGGGSLTLPQTGTRPPLSLTPPPTGNQKR
jgi:uncharacterized membrane protein